MRNNIQQAREALGAHLRQLRRETGLNGRDFAAQLGWTASKVSKLELGQQTPTAVDLTSWAAAAGRPDESANLADELATLETFYTEWRRRLRSGMRFRQQEALGIEDKGAQFRAFNTHYVPGLFQTAEYARHLLLKNALQHGAPDDIDAAVAVRMQRQEVLYRPGKEFHFVLAESALWSQAAAPRDVIVGQLDRLVAATTLGPNVKLGVIPFTAQWPVFLDHGFWIIDDEFVLIETLAAELRLTRPDEIATYARVFEQLSGVAVYGQAGRSAIMRVLVSMASDSEERSS